MFPRLLAVLSLLFLSQGSFSQQSDKASVPSKGGIVIVVLGDRSNPIIIDFSDPWGSLRKPLAELETQRVVGVPVGDSGHITVLKALAAAEGTHPIASLADATIIRGYEEIHINLKRILEGRAKDFSLNAGDVLLLSTTIRRPLDGRFFLQAVYDPPLHAPLQDVIRSISDKVILR